MSKKKFRDPYGEYRASVEAIRMITDNISVLQEHGDGGPTVQDKIAKLSIAMVECADTQMEAKKQFNEHIALTKQHIESAKELALIEATPVSECLFHIACALGQVFQQEPIGEDDEKEQTQEN